MKIPVIKNTSNDLPKYETEYSAGCDLRAELSNIKEETLTQACIIHFMDGNKIAKKLVIKPSGRALIPTGLKMALPEGYEASVRPRSGLALKHGITVLNTPGTIDADYRGDIGVIIINHGFDDFEIKQGDKIAQMVISKVEHAEFVLSEQLNQTDRGEGGFGSTGK